jgi:hypothetical protein
MGIFLRCMGFFLGCLNFFIGFMGSFLNCLDFYISYISFVFGCLGHLAFFLVSLDFLNTWYFQHTTKLGQSFIVRWKPPIWMKTYEIYFKEYINMIYKIVNNPRPNMHRFLDLGPNMHEL